MDQFVDRSGLFAVAGRREAAAVAVSGLQALQHRGASGFSLATSNGRSVRQRTAFGLVGARAVELDALDGALAIGCVFGGSDAGARAPWIEPEDSEGGEGEAAAPTEPREPSRLVLGRCRGSAVAVAVNGRFTNGARLRQDLSDDGALFLGPTDSELLLHLVASSGQRRFVNRLVDALWKVDGAYALLLVSEDHLIAVRDPSGHRPLVLGRFGDAHVFASEDGAIRAAGGEVRREVYPGEMIIVDARGMSSVQPFAAREVRRCAQEVVALARNDATIAGTAVHTARFALGEELGRSFPCPGADLVCAVPGADPLAQGYAEATGVRFGGALVREPPDVRTRAVSALVHERTVVLVAPSLGTGRDVRSSVRRLLEAGASAVHLRVGSPPVLSSCPFGVGSPLPEELVAVRTPDGAAEAVGAATVAWLSLDATRRIVGPNGVGSCESCFVPRSASEQADDQLPLF